MSKAKIKTMKMIKKIGTTRTNSNKMMMMKIGRMRKMNANNKIKRELNRKARRKSVRISVIVDLIFD